MPNPAATNPSLGRYANTETERRAELRAARDGGDGRAIGATRRQRRSRAAGTWEAGRGATQKAVPERPFLSLLRYNLPYRRAYAAGAFLAVLFVIVGLVMPVVVRAIVAGFEGGTMTRGLLGLYFAGLLAAAAVTGVARYFQRTLMIGASRRFEYALRNDYFHQVQRLSPSFFHRMATGDIMARATNDLNYVRDFIGPGIMGTVDMIRVPFTLAMMVYFSGRLTLYSLVPLPALSILVYFFVRYMHRQSKVVQELFSQVTSLVQENLAGVRVVKAFGIADRELRTFRQASREYMRANIKLVAVMSFIWPLIGAVVGLVVLTVIWQGGKMVIHDQLSLADMTAFLICMIMLAWPLAQFGWVLTLYQRGAVGMNRISEILAQVPEVQDGEQTRYNAVVRHGAIRFDHVSFSYGRVAFHRDRQATPPEVLRDVSFDIHPGQTVAFAGPTGSGKTSLVSLLTRAYDPVSGRILIDGQDLREIPLQTLRRAIGYVPQDIFVFSDTIRENIRLGRPDASDEHIRQACRIAQFSEDIEAMPRRATARPGGLDTLLGERGINLSGGQKQRLTLARAILCEPTILILDDALSSVDTHTEERILHGLRELMTQRTSIIISHRISTIRHADLILVVDDGQIAEQGNHDALLARDGIYAAMYRHQLLEAALEEEPPERQHGE